MMMIDVLPIPIEPKPYLKDIYELLSRISYNKIWG